MWAYFWGRPFYLKRALLAIALCWAVGNSVIQGYHWHQVQVNTVDPTICTQGGDGPVTQVWEYTGEKGVFHVHCHNGFVGVEGYK